MSIVTLLQTFDMSVTPLGTSGLSVTGIDAYDEILFVCTDLVTATANNPVFLRLSNNGGASYRSGASDYSRAYMRGRVSYSYGATFGFNALPVFDEDVNAVGSWGRFSVLEPGRSGMKTVVVSHMSSAEYHWTLSGQVETAEVNDAVQIFANAGNFTSGRIRVYGITYASFDVLLNRDFAVSNLSTSGPHIDISGIDAYDEIWFRASGLTGSNANCELRLRLSADGGSTFDSGASDYFVAQHNSTHSEALASSMICYARGDASGHVAGKICLHNKASVKTILEQHGSGDTLPTMSVATKESDEINDALRILAVNGNFTGGDLLVYGVNY